MYIVNTEIFVTAIFCGLNFVGENLLWLRVARKNLIATKILPRQEQLMRLSST